MNPQIIHSHFKTKLARAFVTGAFAILLAALAGSASANTISWHVDNGNGPLAAANFAGVNLVSNWTVVTANGTVSSLKDNSNATTTASIVASSAYGPWRMSSTTPGQDTDTSYNKRMINPYLNNGGATSTAISGIPYAQYSIYVYFSSDTAGRTGTISDGTTTYTFTTIGPNSISGGNATLTQTAATSGNPSANYAVFTNETSTSKTITCNVGSGGGISSVQIVDATLPFISLATDISADSPATNYVGRTVTLSAAITGTAPITNHWAVNKGSGYVSIANATNSTLILTNAQVSDSGIYELVATNSAGSTNTSPLTLTFLAAPTPNTNQIVNLQFTGFTGGGTAAATQTGAAVIGNTGDVWNTVFSTGGSFTAGTGLTASNGTPIYLNNAANIGTTISLKYVVDYLYNAGTGPFASTPVAGLMSGLAGVQSSRTGTLTVSNLAAGGYDLYLYGQNSGVQTRSSTFVANGVSAVCGPNSSVNTLTSPNNYVHLAPTVTSNGVLTITFTGAASGDAQLNGFQLSGPGAAPTLSLATDTTASPSTNFYVGGAVTFSASFVGTQPITNQWEVNTGSGFVPITGATNTTLTLTNLQLINSGASYSLFASNLAGSSNSTPVTLSVLALPTNSLGINVQFTGSWAGGGNCPTYTGAAVIGGGADVWNAVSNPTGGTSPAGLAGGTNLVLFDTGNITTPITMDYVADYIFSGTYDPGVNPFIAAGSPVAPLMTGYMGSVSQGSTADTNTITLRHLVPGIYDLYLYVCGRSDGQGRVDVFSANNQNGVVCGPNSGNSSLTSGVNYVHLTPTVTTNGVLNISYYGTTDAGQGLLNGFQLNGPDTNISLAISSDTSCDSPLNDYVGRTVTFSAAFAGSPAPALQWEVDNGSGYVLIPGATNSTLLLTNLQTTNSGNYALFATNAAGVLNSTPLTLNVQTLPSPLAINVQFDGTTYTGSHATPQVGGAVVGGGSDYWNPVSNPKPLVGDTNPISGSLVLLDVNNYGTPMSLTYTGASQDYNNGNNTPFNGSGSPAANLMQASLVTLNSNTASVTMHGIPAGVYDLYLYSCDSSSLQQNVTRFSANDAYDTSGPNDANNVLTLETNYVHLTPTVTANGLLTISFTGTANGRGNLNGVQLSGPGATILPPVASFTATPTKVFATQSVAFTDTSSGNITNWVWTFGDGSSLTNTSGSASHAYAAAGAYTVSLTANGPGGANTTNVVDAVTVYAQPTLGSPVLSAGSLTFSGTGGIPNAQYRILTSTNVALPLAGWAPVATNTFAPDGSYSYTQSFLTNAASFFLLVTP
jgi:PKD repeat protein